MADKKDDIVSELEDLSPFLARIPRLNAFHVPPGYFDTLPVHISFKINEKDNFQTIPAGYFEAFPDKIMDRIRNTSSSVLTMDDEHPEILSSIGNRNIFNVPDGYFHSLTDVVKENIQKAEVPVIQIQGRVSFFKYAVAAVVTGILGLSLFSLLNKSDNLNEDVRPMIAQANKIIKTKSFDAVLNSLGDEEIISYLESHGKDVNAALVASAAESNDLPDEFDYYTKENTLSDFLKKLDIETNQTNK